MMSNEYYCYGRRFRVEKLPSGMFQLVGRAQGFPPYPLDKVGLRDTRESAQSALDHWARKQCLRPIKKADATTQMSLGIGNRLEAENG